MTLAAIDPIGTAWLFLGSPFVQIAICWFAADALRHVPAQQRFLKPGRAWLLMIPLFQLYWNFKVFSAIVESFQLHFYSRGIADVEDCGESLARAYCWLSVCALIPCANLALIPVSFVVVVVFFVEIDKLKKRALSAPTA